MKRADVAQAADAEIMVLQMDQGPVGMGCASFLHFHQTNLIHCQWDGYHRLVRDMKLDVVGIGPKAYRKKLLQSQLCSAFLWSVNYKPYGSGGFFAAKKELLDYFISSRSEVLGGSGMKSLVKFG